MMESADATVRLRRTVYTLLTLVTISEISRVTIGHKRSKSQTRSTPSAMAPAIPTRARLFENRSGALLAIGAKGMRAFGHAPAVIAAALDLVN